MEVLVLNRGPLCLLMTIILLLGRSVGYLIPASYQDTDMDDILSPRGKYVNSIETWIVIFLNVLGSYKGMPLICLLRLMTTDYCAILLGRTLGPLNGGNRAVFTPPFLQGFGGRDRSTITSTLQTSGSVAAPRRHQRTATATLATGTWVTFAVKGCSI